MVITCPSFFTEETVTILSCKVFGPAEFVQSRVLDNQSSKFLTVPGI